MKQKYFFGSLLLLIFLTPIIAPLKKSIMVAPHEFKFYISSVIIFICFVFLLINQKDSKYIKIKKSVFYLPITLFLAWAILSSSWAINSYESYSLWLKLFAASSMFLLVLNSINSKYQFELILKVIFLSAVIISLVGISQYLFDIELIRQAVSPASTFGNKNTASHFIVLTLPLGIGLFLYTTNQKEKYIYILGVLIILIYLFYTKTRAGWLAVGVEFLVLLIFIILDKIKNKTNFKLKNQVPIFILLAFVLIAIANLTNKKIDFTANVSSIFSEATISEEGNARIQSWVNTLEIIKDNPIIGVGLGNWFINYPLYHNKAAQGRLFNENSQLRYAHNDYLETLAELGIIGFVLILWMLYLVLKCIYSVIFNNNNKQRFLILAITLALIGFAINANFSFPIAMYVPVFIIMIYLALIQFSYINDVLSEDAGNIKKKNYFYKIDKKNKNLLIIVFLAIAMYLVHNNYKTAKAEDLYWQAELLERKGRWSKLEEVALESYKNNSNRVRIGGYLGEALSHQGKHKEAIKYFNESLKLTPYNINILAFIAQAYVRAKDYKNAEKSYLNAISIYPNWAKAHKNLGVLYVNYLKQPKKAVKHFKLALEYNHNISQANIIRNFINKYGKNGKKK